MKKRGVSPLIASVLLIAFVIILFTTITLWIRNSAINPAMQETEGRIASDLEAMNTKISVENIELDGNSLKLIITNQGSTEIKDFSVRVIGSSGVDVIEIEESLGELESITKDIIFDLSKTGSVNKIEVIPILSSGLAIGATIFKSDLRDLSLIAYYGFEGNANDLSGNGNDGTVYGADCNVEGKFGLACSFDGGSSGGYIDVADDTSLKFGTGAFSINVWINPLSNTIIDVGIIEKGKGDWSTSANSRTGWYLGETYSSYYKFVMSDGDTGVHGDVINFGNLDNVGWTHLLITVDDAGDTSPQIRGYKNGVEVVSTARTNALDSIDVTHKLNIGRNRQYNRYFNGTIDEVKIYDRALLEEEIKAEAMVS